MRHAQGNTSSIRDQLEQEARHLYPNLYQRLARRRGVKQKRSLRWQDRTLLIVAAVLMMALLLRGEPAFAQDDIEYGIEWSGGTATAVNTQIGIEITGMVARAEVTQVFQNRGSDWAEATYRFPLPEGAAVDQLQIEVGNRVLVGEIQEKQTARRIYQKARNNGQTATLVEQQRPNQFETRLANVAPGEVVRITIGFLSTVNYRDGEFSFQFPMTFTPRAGGSNQRFELETSPRPMLTSWADTPSPASTHQLDLGISLQTGLVLSKIDSRYHDVDIHPTTDGYHIFVTEQLARTDRIFELTWVPELGTAPQTSLTTWEDGDSVYALLMLAPPLQDEVAPQPREVIFVIDTSGSMEGESIKQARSALLHGLAYLEQDDLFNVIQFNSGHEQLFRNPVMPMTAELEAAADYIEGLAANGGTNMGPALHAAMTLPASTDHLRQIVFITDGSVGNEHDLLLQIGEELGDSRLFTVSIGAAPNTWFMNKSSIIGRGSHTHIGKLDAVESAMADLWNHIQTPALMNIEVDWGMDSEFFPEVIPDLYAGEPLWLYAKLPSQPREVSINGLLVDSPWEQHAQPLHSKGNETLATLWARSKIESLEDSRLFGTDPQWIREQVTDLALDYGMLTAYTSLVAVDKTPARPARQNLRSDNIPSLLPAGSSANATGFSATAAGWKLQLILSFITLAIASGLFFFPTGLLGRKSASTRQPMAPSTPPCRAIPTA